MRDEGEHAKIEALLEEGLEHYGRGRAAAAARCWREVLALSPGEARALDYLASAGFSAAPAAAPAPAPAAEPTTRRAPPRSGVALSPVGIDVEDELARATVNREVLGDLLGTGRYEEALRWLATELRHRPADDALRRSVERLEERLAASHERELGDLDRVLAVQASPAALRRLSADHLRLLQEVDGVATIREVLASSPLGAYATRRLLADLIANATLGVARAAAPVSARRSRNRTPATKPGALGRTWIAPSGQADDGCGGLFERATEAYLHGRHDEALTLYEECLATCPSHRRAAINVAALKRRSGT